MERQEKTHSTGNKRSPSTPLNVLFIGNSFTARNNLPGLIAQLAESIGSRLQHRLITSGGASLRMHWNRGEAQKEILATRYDYVVLQEQSTLPVKNPQRMHENIRLFDEIIRSSGAGTALYMTWARSNAPETRKSITEAYQSIGEELKALVIPVGLAWRNFIDQYDHPVLHDADASHPTLAGSYLAACVFFAAMFGKSPVDAHAHPADMTATEARMLQLTAWTTVKEERIRNKRK
ncbi:MAG: hypothetical protein KIT57_22535 [Blastocatellales bacterium]|nr:hypothetical protein [Blastocatellales bacterium]